MDDTYTGHVAPGNRSRRQLSQLGITKMSVGTMDNNAYLLTCITTGQCLLIDAAAQPQRILDELGEHPLVGIVTTHRHSDHWGAGLATVVAATGASTYAGAEDVGGIGVATSHPLHHGALVSFGAIQLSVIGLRGHTPGGIALHYAPDGGHLFSGDSLFPGGPGNTDHDPERFAQLLTDLESRVFGLLPDRTWVYPGHGDDTTIGTERPLLPEWRARGW